MVAIYWGGGELLPLKHPRYNFVTLIAGVLIIVS